MSLKIYNTATRSKEDFAPLHPPAVTMYNCGPTVYDYFHIGNARNFVVVDTVRRYLIFRGYDVRFAQNFTDIDDKIINRSAERGEAWDHLAQRFTDYYFQMAEALGVMRADIHPKATDHIPHMIALIQQLEAKGLAYARGGDVYYRVRAFDSYGKLSGRNVDDLLEGARVDVTADQKEDPLDFALWKAAKPGEPSWESPWGPGRPGWHIECSAMSMHHLGETIDIHSGGIDLVFPHHENERAQSEGSTGHEFVRYWLHNGFVTRDAEKMSKSLGNFFTINEVLEKYPAASVRFALVSAHYRHPIDYSETALKEASAAIARIREAVQTVEKLLGSNSPAPGATEKQQADAALEAFTTGMDDDFNTQRAIGVIFETVATLNEVRKGMSSGAPEEAAAARRTCAALAAVIHTMLEPLGLDALIFNAGNEAASTDANATGGDTAQMGKLIDLLIEARAMAKSAKQFALADHIRDQLAAMNIRLQDHPTGTIWLRD